MNQFQNTQSGQGLLKNYYDPELKRKSTELALKKKRDKLMDTKLGVDENEDDWEG